MNVSHTTTQYYRIAMGGLLLIFAARILIELGPTIYVGVAIAAVSLGVILSKITSKHFDHGHHHAGDSAIDAVPVMVLLFANIAHPAIDGFSAVETFRIGGVIAGIAYAGSIVFHEILRQAAFVSALQPLHINWKWVTGTALVGILIGVGAAVGGARFFDRYEIIADLATLFSYSFVIAEFHFISAETRSKNTGALFLLGAIVGLIIIFLMKTG